MMAFTTPPPKTPTVPSSIPGSQGQTLLHPPPKQKYRFTPVSGIVTVALLGGASLLSILGSRSAAPSPGTAVTSRYHVGATLAGAADTSLHISGAGFATNSAITFLLDGASAPGAPRAQSNSSGQVQADLKIGAGWSVGKHTLTARDAQGETAANGVIITVVPQGEAMTPGPHNAPSDSQTFSFTAAIRPADAVTGAPLPSLPIPWWSAAGQTRQAAQSATPGTILGNPSLQQASVMASHIRRPSSPHATASIKAASLPTSKRSPAIRSSSPTASPAGQTCQWCINRLPAASPTRRPSAASTAPTR